MHTTERKTEKKSEKWFTIYRYIQINYSILEFILTPTHCDAFWGFFPSHTLKGKKIGGLVSEKFMEKQKLVMTFEVQKNLRNFS